MQYAGNVLVYSAISPCNGDWFGGINPENAEAFLDAVADVEFGSSGGVSDDTLRQYWRGRMGLTKEEQLQVSDKRVIMPTVLQSLRTQTSPYQHIMILRHTSCL